MTDWSTALCMTIDRSDQDTGDDDDDDKPVLSVSAAFNTLNLVKRNAGYARFVKYINFQAPGSRWDIENEYRIAQ
jgi:hypothetical protein